MKVERTAGLLLLVLAPACRPDVGPPISQISGPAVLAVKGEPPEVDLRGGSVGATVAYEALAVDANGRVPGPTSDISDSLLWAMCDKPKPPTENNSVSTSCLDPYALPGVPGPSPTAFSSPVLAEGCALFGPTTPPAAEGQPAIRPRDADVTGGYYQPLRVELLVPEALRRPGMATGDALISVQLQRIQCGLANAPGEVNREYTANYRLNNNPRLTALSIQVPGLDPVEMPLGPTATSLNVPAGQEIGLVARWSEDSVETYPAWDLVHRQLVYHRESMRVSWYATGGTFAHDITGRGEDETQADAENRWKSDVPRLVHLWLVLHDARGGTDFAAADIDVVP